MALTAGARLGPYEVVELLGAGSMGEVYRARDTRLGRDVALKVLPPEIATEADRLRRFEQEACAVAALNHPHILTLYDVGTHEGTPYVVTELLEGENLREILTRRKPTQRQVLGWAVQTAQGLAAAHQKGIVHRDLKPENVFVTTDGRVKILVFGLAKLAGADSADREAVTESRPTRPGLLMGTVPYMSPEQVQGLGVDARSDIFSFGVVLYELLARRHPFRRETVGGTLTAILQEAPPPLASLDPSIPRAVDGIVRRCLEKRREERFQGAHDLGLALEAVLQAPTGAAVLEEVEERSPYPGLSPWRDPPLADAGSLEAAAPHPAARRATGEAEVADQPPRRARPWLRHWLEGRDRPLPRLGDRPGVEPVGPGDRGGLKAEGRVSAGKDPLRRNPLVVKRPSSLGGGRGQDLTRLRRRR